MIARLTAGWREDRDRWQGRDPPARRQAPIWADGVCPQARGEPGAECMPAILGATPEGRKGPLGFHVGIRESARGWRESPIGIKARGLAIAPGVAVGDGAPGFRRAVDGLFPGARHQRRWFHKVSNVPNKVPKPMGPTVKPDPRDIHHAEAKAAALAAVEAFKEKHGARHPPADARPTKDTAAAGVP